MSTTTLDGGRAAAPARAPRGHEVAGSSGDRGSASARATTVSAGSTATSGRAGSASRTPASRRARGRDAEATVTEHGTPSGATAPFVLLIMVLLTCGLVATLGLSTAAAADSYRLDEARGVARDLTEQSERLHREVEAARSAPALAAAASAQGLVPAGNPAVLLVAPDGSTRVIGDARPARAAPARPSPTPAAGAAGTTGAAGTAATGATADPAGAPAPPASTPATSGDPGADEQLRAAPPAAPTGPESGR